jgi:uncharacterized phage protein gp47/JayE
MIPPLTELVVRVPVETLFSQSLQVAADLGMPETAWQAISIGREVMYINSQLAANFSVVMQEGVAAGGFLTYASGKWLTLCAYETFDTERIDASSATGVIGLENTTDTAYLFGVGAVRVLNETNGKTYSNQDAGTVPAFGTIETIAFVADEPGTGSDLVSTDTLKLVTTVPGVTPYFVENLIGRNEETDPELRSRARSANAKASPNGPSDAYDYYAKTTDRPDGSSVGVTRTNVVEGNGTVTVWCADPDGALTSEDRGYVFANINANVVPTGFTVIVPQPSCTEKAIALAFTLTPNPESSTPKVQSEAAAEAAIAAYFSSIPVGGDKAQSFRGVYVQTLETLVRNATGDAVLNAIATLPAADVALVNSEVPVISSISFTWLS